MPPGTYYPESPPPTPSLLTRPMPPPRPPPPFSLPAVYSLEDSDGFQRYNFDAIVSNYSLSTVYLPAWRMSVVGANATGVMCSYNAVNGIPTCAHPMLRHILRDVWGFNGYVTS